MELCQSEKILCAQRTDLQLSPLKFGRFLSTIPYEEAIAEDALEVQTTGIKSLHVHWLP